MTTTFTATIKIKVTHDRDTFIDTNSVKGLIGPGITRIRKQGVGCLSAVGDKTEGPPERVLVELTKLKEGQYQIEIDDMEDYL